MTYASINGADLFYEDSGVGEALIFQHGYTSSHDCWEGVIPALNSRYRCVALDCRGAGESNAAAGPNTIEQYAADVIALADHLGIGRFTYIGLSMGGGVGFQLGLTQAGRLEKLVLVAPVPADGVQGPEAGFEASLRQWEAKEREAMLRQRIITGGQPNPEYLGRAVDRTLAVSRGHFVDSWRSMQGFRAGARLAQITTPTLMVAGAVDGLLPSNLADFQRLGNATLHVFSRVGHGIPYEAPGQLAAVIADFLEHGVITFATRQAELRAATAAK